MDNKDFDFLFDEKSKNNIKNSFDDVVFNNELKEKIKIEALRNKTLREKVNDILNYEFEILVGRLGAIAVIVAIIPTSFTIYEGRKIIDNSIKCPENTIAYKKYDK